MIIAINAVENIRNAETVVDTAALEPGGENIRKESWPAENGGTY